MIDKSSIIQVFGSLMKHPQFLSESDKYKLSLNDFSTSLDRYIYSAIYNLYVNGASVINPIDVENYLSLNEKGKNIFSKQGGLDYLQDAIELSEPGNFSYYYNKLKKINLLNNLKSLGIDTSEFYEENPFSEKAFETNANFEKLEIEDIINACKKKLLKVEKEFVQGGDVESWDVLTELEKVIENFGSEEGIGLPINGDICTQVLNGAELGALTIRSGPSGIAKTRLAVADACKLAFPFRYSEEEGKWVKAGTGEKVLFIMTEQRPDQILKMILSYLTEINESKFKFGDLNTKEKKRIEKAREIISHYRDNLSLMRIPDPDIEQIKLAVREKVITNEISYLFFDYVFISNNLLSEFRGNGIRNDEALFLMTTALKDLAIELNISVFTSTQVNAKADNNQGVRNESSLAGSRAIINKADNGIIMARPTKDELDILLKEGTTIQGKIPNIVFDVYKVRSGQWTQVKIWSYFDAGTLRLYDLFITDQYLNVISNFFQGQKMVEWDLEEEDLKFLEGLNS